MGRELELQEFAGQEVLGKNPVRLFKDHDERCEHLSENDAWGRVANKSLSQRRGRRFPPARNIARWWSFPRGRCRDSFGKNLPA